MGRRHHVVDDWSLVRHVGTYRQPHGSVRGLYQNEKYMLNVLRMHRDASYQIENDNVVQADLLEAGREAWEAAVRDGEEYGVRNSQASVLAPTGTIGLMMDCDTTGIEPDLGLVKIKKLVGGGTMSIVNQTIPRALTRLGYTDQQISDIIAYIDTNKSIIGAPALKPEHLASSHARWATTRSTTRVTCA